MGISTMRQWIEMAELVFQQSMEKEEKSTIHWYFPLKDKPHRHSTHRNNNTNTTILQQTEKNRETTTGKIQSRIIECLLLHFLL